MTAVKQQKFYGLWHVNSLPPDLSEHIEAMWWFDEDVYSDNPECFPLGPNSLVKKLKKNKVLDDLVTYEMDKNTLVVNFKDLSHGCLFIVRLNKYLRLARRKYLEKQ